MTFSNTYVNRLKANIVKLGSYIPWISVFLDSTCFYSSHQNFHGKYVMLSTQFHEYTFKLGA